ncbi:MAG: protein kinase [Sulfuritalea sp.]|nr:protein kinase [Sulfuritalea sp.]
MRHFAESKDPLVGQLLDGRYLIKRVLGEGGMGTVYAAQRPNIEKLFAVKVLKQDLVGGEIAIKRFLREARVLSRLSHDHIVSVHDYGQTSDGLYYLVMEYLHGIPLDSISEPDARQEDLPEPNGGDYDPGCPCSPLCT